MCLFVTLSYCLPLLTVTPPKVASLSDRASEAVRTALLITHDVVQALTQEIRAEGLDALFSVRIHIRSIAGQPPTEISRNYDSHECPPTSKIRKSSKARAPQPPPSRTYNTNPHIRASPCIRPTKVTESVALLDMIFGFADLVTLSPLSFCRPEITSDGPMTIRRGRHPIVGAVQDCKFVPNDTYMRQDCCSFGIVPLASRVEGKRGVSR